jgi:hypothetical protein
VTALVASPSRRNQTKWIAVAQVEDDSVLETLLAYKLMKLNIMIAYSEANFIILLLYNEAFLY